MQKGNSFTYLIRELCLDGRGKTTHQVSQPLSCFSADPRAQRGLEGHPCLLPEISPANAKRLSLPTAPECACLSEGPKLWG